MDLAALRQQIEPVVLGLATYTHREMDQWFPRLGLSEPPWHPGPDGKPGPTKAQRTSGAMAALADADLPAVARRILDESPVSLDTKTKYAIEDVLWAAQGAHPIPTRTRRELAKDLNQVEIVHNGDRFMALLDGLWVLDDDPLAAWAVFDTTGRIRGLRGEIEQHFLRNDDWPVEVLFERLGAYEASDKRFALFLEGLVSPQVLPDEPAQRAIVEVVNPHLRSIGAELRETGEDGGYPVFTLVSTSAARNRSPKNLVFATPKKPDIRLKSAVDNDIEIVGAGDELVYDRPIGKDGLSWGDLQAWWMERGQLDSDDEAKKSLYRKLIGSLPDNSPPQRNLYVAYHEIYRDKVHSLPALLPEVWLHWDPKTYKQRGLEAMLRMRMDFLLLLPGGHRVVLEVDGMTHYTNVSKQPDPYRYAENVRGDRELKLSGYEVFRFGAVELLDPTDARAVLEPFFAELFRRFGVNAEPLA